MRGRWLAILLLYAVPSLAQDNQWWLEGQVGIRLQHGLAKQHRTFHTSIRPYMVHEMDSVMEGDGFRPGKLGEDKPSYIRIAPIATVMGMYGDLSFKGRYGIHTEAGADVGAGYKNKLFLNLNFAAGNMHLHKYSAILADSLGALPGFGPVYKNGPLFGYQTWGGHLSWQANKYINLHLGRGMNFWGEGYRTLFLGDANSNYNFFRATANIWRIKYAFLVGQFDNPGNYPNGLTPWEKKFSSMHYLSFNITEWWNIGLFEAVVWESEDSAVNRTVDINYLNPLIFFRPVEYSIGSSDNSLIGAQTVVKTGIGLQLYAQVLLDEFLLDSVRAGNGWYANKQAMQLGWKWFDPLNLSNTFLQGEVNVVRPFVYGHSNENHSFTHRGLMLSHPLGANFYEGVARAAWFNEKLFVSATGTFARKGFPSGYINGADPLVPSEPGNLAKISGYNLLDGQLGTIAQIRLEGSYLLVKEWNLRIEAMAGHRWDVGYQPSNNNLFVMAGIRTAFRNKYRDY